VQNQNLAHLAILPSARRGATFCPSRRNNPFNQLPAQLDLDLDQKPDCPANRMRDPGLEFSRNPVISKRRAAVKRERPECRVEKRSAFHQAGTDHRRKALRFSALRFGDRWTI
jgi:hypothetical protein